MVWPKKGGTQYKLHCYREKKLFNICVFFSFVQVVLFAAQKVSEGQATPDTPLDFVLQSLGHLAVLGR